MSFLRLLQACTAPPFLQAHFNRATWSAGMSRCVPDVTPDGALHQTQEVLDITRVMRHTAGAERRGNIAVAARVRSQGPALLRLRHCRPQRLRGDPHPRVVRHPFLRCTIQDNFVTPCTHRLIFICPCVDFVLSGIPLLVSTFTDFPLLAGRM